jgi:N-acetylglutamate synthase-like GNAT family acetyltransferase
MSPEIRKASKTDLNHIQAIHRELNRPPRDSYPHEEFLIAWIDGEAIGCAGASVYQDGGYFYGLAVRRDWQKQGVGGKLMQARIDALSGTGAHYAIALVMFWNSRFFRKFGFAPIKRELLPSSATFHADIKNPSLRRSAVMLRSMR